MMCKVHAILSALLALGALGALAGCAEEPLGSRTAGPLAAMTGAELATVGRPGPPDLPFGEALATYAREVAGFHADEGPRADAKIAWAVRQLAVILERMPAAAAEPGLRRAADAMRAQAEEPSMTEQQRSLSIAATALLGLARQQYPEAPEIAAYARAFAGAVSAVDAGRSPPDRAGAINALVRAERVLAAMYAVNVAPPRAPAAGGPG